MFFVIIAHLLLCSGDLLVCPHPGIGSSNPLNPKGKTDGWMDGLYFQKYSSTQFLFLIFFFRFFYCSSCLLKDKLCDSP